MPEALLSVPFSGEGQLRGHWEDGGVPRGAHAEMRDKDPLTAGTAGRHPESPRPQFWEEHLRAPWDQRLAASPTRTGGP